MDPDKRTPLKHSHPPDSTTAELEVYPGSVGGDEIRNVINSPCFIDKSIIIKHVLLCEKKTVVATAPRRWGKSLNLDLIRLYVEASNDERCMNLEDKECYKIFKNLKISQIETTSDILQNQHMAKYPTIVLNFKCDGNIYNLDDVVAIVRNSIRNAFLDHMYLLDDPARNEPNDPFPIRTFLKWNHKENYTDFGETALQLQVNCLAECLKDHYGHACYLFVDEYDSVLNKAAVDIKTEDVLKKCVTFVMGLILHLCKQNRNVAATYITGISQIGTFGIGGSNFHRCPFLMSGTLIECFGFDNAEIDLLFQRFKDRTSEKKSCLSKDMLLKYNGYVGVGGKKMFNPYAVSSLLMEKPGSLQFGDVWSTSSFVLSFEDVFKMDDIKKRLLRLLETNGQIILMYKSARSYRDLMTIQNICTITDVNEDNVHVFFTFLFENGYLSLEPQYLKSLEDPEHIVEEEQQSSEITEEELQKKLAFITVQLPNIEVHDLIKNSLKSYVHAEWKLKYNLVEKCADLLGSVINLVQGTETDQIYSLAKDIRQSIEKMTSSLKIDESYLHALLLIICWEFQTRKENMFQFKAKCGRECTSGELDLVLYNRQSLIICEAKYNASPKTAIKQIIDNNYLNVVSTLKDYLNEEHKYAFLGINLSESKTITMGVLINSTEINNFKFIGSR